MVFTDLIEKKKRGQALTKEELEFFIDGIMSGEIPDYQTASFLMAIVLKGMNKEETFYLTMAMTNSGEIIKKGEINGVCVDKHSTGGVSDSTTLIVVPVCAVLGLKFAKLSGRGLGHTGGTIDKLESFKGFNVNLSGEEIVQTVNKTGAAICGQTEETAPADKKLYALRDVTCTVDSISLIASSIMSKKLASFAEVIVLDVKYGTGAFMKTIEEAVTLAKEMVDIGKSAGRKISAVITDMNQPLGNAVGCNLEVRSAIEVLSGKQNRLAIVSKALCVEILVNAGWQEKDAEVAVNKVIADGTAKEKLKEIVFTQGGDIECIDNPELLTLAKYKQAITCEKGGYLSEIKTEEIGNVNVLLGGGRMKKTDEIDHECGIIIRAELGDELKQGDVLAEIYTNKDHVVSTAEKRLKEAFVVSNEKVNGGALIHKIVR